MASEIPAGPNGQTVVRTKDVKKIYTMGKVKVPALKGITLNIQTGEYVSIMGPSGSGKSTLFNMIGGLDKPSSGHVYIDEVDVAQLDAYELAWLRCRKIGYIFQTFNLIPVMTALENVTLPMVFAGLDADEARDKGASLLELVGLRRDGDAQLRTYSKGMLQRIGVAQALINDPRLVVLDEPMSGLDPAGRNLIRNVILGMRDEGRTVFFSSHILSDVEMICDRIAILVEGRLHYTGGVEELLQERADHVELRVEEASPELLERLRATATEVSEVGSQWLIRVHDGDPAQAMLAQLTEAGARVISITPLRPSLEDLFVRELAGEAAEPEERPGA